MAWHAPLALLLLLVVPAAAYLMVRAARRRHRALVVFGTAGADPGERLLRRVRGALVLAALAALAVALAGPRYGTELREVRQEGLDLVVVLDVSRSMLAEDVAPNRLERARFEVDRLLGRLQGSRVGLVLFAGEAYLHTPLTTDLATLRTYLQIADPDLIPTQGTDFGEALAVATGAFALTDPTAEPRARVVLVVSDGEGHAGRYESALRTAENNGILLFAAGVGEPLGARIPAAEGTRPGAFHTDAAGQVVETRLVEESLRRIARSGAYFRIGRDGSTLGELPAALARLDRSALASDRFAAYAERFQVPLALALLLLALDPLIARRRAPQPA